MVGSGFRSVEVGVREGFIKKSGKRQECGKEIHHNAALMNFE